MAFLQFHVTLEVRTISEWNKLSQDVRSKPSVVSFCSTLLKTPGPVENGTPAAMDIY